VLECLSSAIFRRPISYAIRWELYISLLKAVCAAATSNMVRAPCTSRFGLVGLRRVETHGAGPHKLLGSDPIDFRESLKIKARRKIKAKVKRKDQPE